MVITLDLGLTQLNNLRILIDILYDSYIKETSPDMGGADSFKNVLDTLSIAVDREIADIKREESRK